MLTDFSGPVSSKPPIRHNPWLVMSDLGKNACCIFHWDGQVDLHLSAQQKHNEHSIQMQFADSDGSVMHDWRVPLDVCV